MPQFFTDSELEMRCVSAPPSRRRDRATSTGIRAGRRAGAGFIIFVIAFMLFASRTIVLLFPVSRMFDNTFEARSLYDGVWLADPCFWQSDVSACDWKKIWIRYLVRRTGIFAFTYVLCDVYATLSSRAESATSIYPC